MAAIELIGRSRPAEFQSDTTNALVVTLAAAIAGDVHVAHVARRGNAQVTPPSGWVLRSSLGTGTMPHDIHEDIYTFIVTEVANPTQVIFQFSHALSEKWVGVQTWRNVDTSELMVTSIEGSIAGNQMVRAGFGYAYAEVSPALFRGDLAIGHSYLRVIQDLQPADIGIGHSYLRVIEDLEYKIGAAYTFADVRLTDSSESFASTNLISEVVLGHPPDADEGGRLIAAVLVGGSIDDIVLPTGWTLVLRDSTNETSTSHPQLHVLTYVTPASPPDDHVFALPSGTARMLGGLVFVGYQGIDDIASSISTVTGDSFTPSVDATESNSILLGIWSGWQVGRFGSWTNHEDPDMSIRTRQPLSSSGITTVPKLMMQRGTVPDVGPTGTRTGKSSGNIQQRVMAAIVIQPAPPITVAQVSADVVRQGEPETHVAQVSADVVRQGEPETRSAQISADVIISKATSGFFNLDANIVSGPPAETDAFFSTDQNIVPEPPTETDAFFNTDQDIEE